MLLGMTAPPSGHKRGDERDSSARVIQDDRPIALLRLKEPNDPALSVFAKFQQIPYGNGG
jgi:hypothetical protein